MNGTFSWLAIGTMAIDTGVSSPPNSTATFSSVDQLACGQHALGRVALVITAHQFQLACRPAGRPWR